MQYNYDFELAALVLQIIILMHFIFVRQFPTEKSRVFGLLLISCIIECGANILSSIGLANTEFVTQGVNELLAFVFFLFEGLVSFLIFLYMMVLCDFDRKRRLVLKCFGTIPFLLFEICVMLTPFIGFFYYIEDKRYYQGFGADFGYYYIAYYFILNITMLLLGWKKVERRMKIILLIYSVIAIAAIGIQFQYRNVLLTSAGNLIILFMIYLSMQNPGELLNPLTGIGNESALQMKMKQLLNHRNSRECTIITFDIRQFHHMNTVFGIGNCNLFLEEVGRYLYQLAGRFHVFQDGDIFSIIVEDSEKRQEVIQQIKQRFSEEWKVKENHMMADVAIVSQQWPGDFATVADFFSMREYLMEKAKKAGAQSVVEADERLLEIFHRRRQVEIAIRRAIRSRSIQIYYQPIYSLREKRIVSLEALIRMQEDEELGYISPEEFIPLAEKNGSIIQIGEIVLEECCKFLAKHVLSNTSLGIRTIHINMSVAECMKQDLKESIMPILNRYHIPPSMITLEITESMAIGAPVLMLRHMKELGEMGMKFALDDYGSGNSNCSCLVKFPFKEVKIDKEMVWAYFKNEAAKIVLENEIKTMKMLDIPMVVEGIEKLEESEAMERLGVEYIQGYYYGKPLAEKECLRYIRNFNSMPEEFGTF